MATEIDHKKIKGVDLTSPTVPATLPISIENVPIAYDDVNNRFYMDLKAVLGAALSKTNPVNVRLSDGTVDIPLPTALDSGALKIKEQSPLTGFATSALQTTLNGYVDGIETLLGAGLPAALDNLALKVREQNPITGFATQTTLALIAGYVDGLEALLGGGLPSALSTDALKVREQGTPTVTVGTFPDNEPFNLNQVGGTAQTGADWTPLLQKLDVALSTRALEAGGNLASILAKLDVALSTRALEAGGNLAAILAKLTSNTNTLARLQPWYQTNFAIVNMGYSATVVAPHGLTDRWSYTVPANRIAMIVSGNCTAIRDATPTTASNVRVFIRTAGAYAVINAEFIGASIGNSAITQIGHGVLQIAAIPISAATADVSTGGTVTFRVAADIMVFDK